MAIKLNKPLGSDIYNIGVHNENSTIIEEALNPLILDVETIKDELPKKFEYRQADTLNIDSGVSENAIYFVTGALTGNLPTSDIPSGGNIIISYNESGVQVKTLITSDGRLFQKNSTNNIWKALTSSVIDNLTTDDSFESLSAKQGKILNDKKLNILYLGSEDSLNFDNVEPGIYICTNPTLSGTYPRGLDTEQKFVLLSLGKTNELCVQIAYLSANQAYYSRYGFMTIVSDAEEFQFTDWSTSDATSTVQVLTEKVETLEQNQIAIELVEL